MQRVWLAAFLTLVGCSQNQSGGGAIDMARNCGLGGDPGDGGPWGGAQVVVVDAITRMVIVNPRFTNPAQCESPPYPFVACGTPFVDQDAGSCAVWYVAFPCGEVIVDAPGYEPQTVAAQSQTCVATDPCGDCTNAIAGEVAVALQPIATDMMDTRDR